ncbi:DNA-binding domain-containing protein [Nitrosomonas aestuarii]|uniref:HvfC family RiPP maturation protein n=1 Tax=Nitrosomonas aestuarii TaxID=52441 RepID=UPI000D2FF9AA|nr:putative DNA-binding domain-containing protein [Nitrosomonas aestuarii]PTN11282.1 hypothetical protein C8R11_11162 [Nitrosomonas aestuarii]
MNTPNTPDRPDFIKLQYAFAAHIRNPEINPPPQNIEERRMKIYCELFYNNVEDFMANTFPVLHSIISNERWHALMRDYFFRHRSSTPIFLEMPREFLKYLEYERAFDPADPPFMLELSHYEWVELALSTLDEKIDQTGFNAYGDVLTGIPVVSPLVWGLSYCFPVHKISPEFQPQVPGVQLTHLIVYRDKDDEIHFIESNPVTTRLLQFMIDNEYMNGQAILQQIATELKHPEPDIVINGGLEIMKDFISRGILLGVRI